MWSFSFVALAAAAVGTAITIADASPLDMHARRDVAFTGYLISTFSDASPQVQWHLSKGNDHQRSDS
jgi:hypothetical protein